MKLKYYMSVVSLRWFNPIWATVHFSGEWDWDGFHLGWLKCSWMDSFRRRSFHNSFLEILYSLGFHFNVEFIIFVMLFLLHSGRESCHSVKRLFGSILFNKKRKCNFVARSVNNLVRHLWQKDRNCNLHWKMPFHGRGSTSSEFVRGKKILSVMDKCTKVSSSFFFLISWKKVFYWDTLK